MFGENGIERRVARDTFKRDMRYGLTLEGSPIRNLARRVSEPRSARVACHIFRTQRAKLVVIKLRGHQPVFGQGQRYAARIARDPSSAPLLGHIGCRAATACRVEDQVSGV